MGRKKRKSVMLKPFCYYCEREFDDEKVLIQHQKAKHFKCTQCNRKLDTAAGLVVHMLQVHKETLNKVPNADSGRDNPDVVIHGMEGVPMDLINEKQALLLEQRGVAKQQKSAHTVFGMNIMSGLMSGMHRMMQDNPELMSMMPQLAGQGSLPGMNPGGMPGLPGVNPFLQGNSAALGMGMPYGLGLNPLGGPPGVGGQNSAVPVAADASGTTALPNNGIGNEAFAAQAAAAAAAATPTQPQPKTGKLAFDVDNDQVSMEERKAMQPKYNCLYRVAVA